MDFALVFVDYAGAVQYIDVDDMPRAVFPEINGDAVVETETREFSGLYGGSGFSAG